VNKNGLARAVKRYRFERNLTQAALALKFGVSQTIISQVERGAVPSERLKFQIERFLEAEREEKASSKK
jgi:transcriptional regulator with XRE-family HTH domain